MEDTAVMENWVGEEVRARWAEFPIGAYPRPLVMLDTRVRLEGEGFVDVDTKMAWHEGAIETDLTIPPAVLGLLPARRQGRATKTVVTISEFSLTNAPFRCDRGPRELPAYRLKITGWRGSCVVLAPEVQCWWPVSEAEWQLGTGGTANVDEDGVTIHFPAFGGVLTEFHRAEFQEHPTTVVGRAITSQRKVPPGTAVVAIGINRMVTGRLAAPLGDRVLLRESGEPITVLPSDANDRRCRS
jgi:hypothetical protein